MGDKQLNVWIDGHLKDALAERAKREKRSVTDLTEEPTVTQNALKYIDFTVELAYYRGFNPKLTVCSQTRNL